jgi:hypothetical protein
MKSFFLGGWIFAVIFGGMLVESAALATFHRQTGRGIPPSRLAGNIGAGLGILLAAFAALRGAPWPLVAIALLGALAAHVVDLRQRWRS